VKLKSKIKTNSETNKRKEIRKAYANATIFGKNFNALDYYEIKWRAKTFVFYAVCFWNDNDDKAWLNLDPIKNFILFPLINLF